jgi:hypothetical protein
MLLIFNPDEHTNTQPTSCPIFLNLSKCGRQWDVLNGTLVISHHELSGILNKINQIWQCIPTQYRHNLTGIIRFDCIPKFDGTTKYITWHDLQGINLGEISLAGVYEINAHAPECISGILRHRNYLAPELAQYHTPYQFIAPLIQAYFYGNNICLLPGKKRGEVGIERMCQEFKKYQMDVTVIDEQTLFRDAPPNLWRYGDLKHTDESEYSKEVWQFLHHEYPHTYFNYFKKNGCDLSHKQLLTNKFNTTWTDFAGQNHHVTANTSAYLKQHKIDYVIKSFTGTRGDDVFIGKDLMLTEWENKIDNIVESNLGFGAFESRFLPKISLPDSSEFAFDINPCFWAENGKLSFLYANSRFHKYSHYKKNHVMNISQGAKLGGMVLDPRFL